MSVGSGALLLRQLHWQTKDRSCADERVLADLLDRLVAVDDAQAEHVEELEVEGHRTSHVEPEYDADLIRVAARVV